MNNTTSDIISEKAKSLLVQLTKDGIAPTDAATIHKIAEDELLADSDRAFLLAYAAQLAPREVTEADVISFMLSAQAALDANQALNRGFVEPVRLSVYAGADPHFSIAGHFGTDWPTSRHVFASGNTIAQTIAAVFKDVGTPDTRAAAMREQAAKLLADADKLTAEAA